MIPILRVFSSEVSLGKIVSLYSSLIFVPYSIARVCGSDKLLRTAGPWLLIPELLPDPAPLSSGQGGTIPS
jgi:hypothetical protein